MEKDKPFASTYEEYSTEAYKYVQNLREPIATKIRSIVESMRDFTERICGYLPTADELQWPELKPNYNQDVTRLIPFHEAYSYGITDAVIYFYINDCLFLRLFRNPDKYIPFLKECKGVIGPDVSQFTDMPEEMRYRHSWCNRAMSSILQYNDVNLYPNITWSKRDSYRYSFPLNLKNSVIAVNSNGVHKNGLTLYRWKRGYQMALEQLSPLHIIRFGKKVEGENASISSYFNNNRLILLKNGRKRK